MHWQKKAENNIFLKIRLTKELLKEEIKKKSIIHHHWAILAFWQTFFEIVKEKSYSNTKKCAQVDEERENMYHLSYDAISFVRISSTLPERPI